MIFKQLPNQTHRNTGFTLIELIVVIVILGILAATALPKYMDMRRNARIAAIKGFEGGLRSGIGSNVAIYYAHRDDSPKWGVNSNFRIVPMNDGTSIWITDLDRLSPPPAEISSATEGLGTLLNCRPTGNSQLASRTRYDCQGFFTYLGSLLQGTSYTSYNGFAFVPNDVPDSFSESMGMLHRPSIKCYVLYWPIGSTNQQPNPRQYQIFSVTDDC